MKYLIIVLAILLGITFYVTSRFAVEEVYLGKVDENLYGNLPGYTAWISKHLNESSCAEKEILSMFDCCGGHIQVYCKKFPFPLYSWTEMHAMENTENSRWWYE